MAQDTRTVEYITALADLSPSQLELVAEIAGAADAESAQILIDVLRHVTKNYEES